MIKFAIGTGLGFLVGGVVAAIVTKKRADGNVMAQFGQALDWTAQARLQAQTPGSAQ